MDYFIDISGFVGAWLLFTGPLNQAALELKEQEIDREGIDAATHGVQPPEPVSAWWWLLPPVGYLLNKRRADAHRRNVMNALAPHQRKQSVAFLDKARGWMLVAAGAFCIAIKETWELVEVFHWPLPVFWILVVGMAIIAFGYTVSSIRRSDKVLEQDS
jgi:hypothetical protein